MQFQKNNTLDTKALGLEFSLAIAKFVTGKENMHYGVWDNLDLVLRIWVRLKNSIQNYCSNTFQKRKS